MRMKGMWKKIEDDRASWLQFYYLEDIPFIFSGMVVKSQKLESLNLKAEWKDVFKEFLLEHVSCVRGIVVPKQVHQDKIVSIKGSQRFSMRKRFNADGLLTDQRGLFLTVQVADCISIYMVDMKKNVVGLVHAGWRGTLMQISRSVVDEAKRNFGCLPKDLKILFGPAIGKCCYEVETDIAILFPSRFVSHTSGSKPKLDLLGYNQALLLEAGVKKQNMFSVDECTYCGPRFLRSYRRSKDKQNRMLAFIGIK